MQIQNFELKILQKEFNQKFIKNCQYPYLFYLYWGIQFLVNKMKEQPHLYIFECFDSILIMI